MLRPSVLGGWGVVPETLYIHTHTLTCCVHGPPKDTINNALAAKIKTFITTWKQGTLFSTWDSTVTWAQYAQGRTCWNQNMYNRICHSSKTVDISSCTFSLTNFCNIRIWYHYIYIFPVFHFVMSSYFKTMQLYKKTSEWQIQAKWILCKWYRNNS